MDATNPYKFKGFGAMDVTKPYEFIGCGAMGLQQTSRNGLGLGLAGYKSMPQLRLFSSPPPRAG